MFARRGRDPACPQRNARRATEEENNRLPKFVMITRFTNAFVTYVTYVSWCSARFLAGTPGGGPYDVTCSLMPLNNNLFLCESIKFPVYP